MPEVTMRVETGSTADGIEQLRRRWAAPDPEAALLVVHGIGEHSGRYRHVGRYFAEHGIDVASFDNRGFGRSGGPRGHVGRFEQFLDDIEERLAERRALDVPVVLLGHSLGGLMATAYLVSDRPQPNLAVLSSPALAVEAPRWQRLVAPVLGRLRPKMFFPSEIDGAGLSRDPDVQRAYTEDPLMVPGATAALGHATFQAMASVNDRLDLVRVPTYVLHGTADPVIPIDASKPLASLDLVTYREWPELLHECLNEPEKDDVMGEIATWIRERLDD